MLVAGPYTTLGRAGRRIWRPKGHKPLTHLPVAEPLQVAIPTQDTEGRLPLGWVAPQLGQGPLVLTDSRKLLWRRGSQMPGHWPVFRCPDHQDSSHGCH